MKISDNYYTPEKVTDSIDVIRSKTGEMMYLIKGSDRALLIDTCLGVGNLRTVVDSLIDKPLTVWISHGHLDHAMGAPLFADCGVYMNEADKDIYIAHSPVAVRQGYIEGGLGAEPGSWDDAEYVPATSPDYTKPLNDGDVIDLGGIHVEAYALPGHTHGSMVFLIPEERILITGDAANSFVFLFDESYSISVEEYRENLISVQKRLEGRFDRCFLMHREMEASKELLNSVIAVCDDILAGNTDDVPFGFMGREAYVAKAFNEKFLRADGGEGNIVYNKKMVRKNA